MVTPNNPEFNRRVAKAWVENLSMNELCLELEKIKRSTFTEALSNEAARRLRLVKPLMDAVDAYEAASKAREHLGSYGFRVQDAALAVAKAME